MMKAKRNIVFWFTMIPELIGLFGLAVRDRKEARRIYGLKLKEKEENEIERIIAG
jgi:hypothetical protein